MDPAWVAVALTVLMLVASALVNVFLIGKKTGEIKTEIVVVRSDIIGLIKAIDVENEHCRRDRHGMRNVMQLQQGDLAEHGEQIAVLMDRQEQSKRSNHDG